MAATKRQLLWHQYDIRAGQVQPVIFALRTLNRESLATTAENLNTFYAKLTTISGSSTATYITADVGSAAQSGALQISTASTGMITFTPSSTAVWATAGSPYHFFIQTSTASNFTGAAYDWPEGERGEINVI